MIVHSIQFRMRWMDAHQPLTMLCAACILLAFILTAARTAAQTTDGSLLVQADVAGTTATFLLDTGANLSVLDVSWVALHPLAQVGTTELTMVFTKETAPMLLVPNLNLDKVHLSGLRFGVIDLRQLSGAIGQQIDGILGTDVLRNFIVTLDYSKGLVQFAPLSHSIGVGALHLKVIQGRFLLPVKIEGSAFNLLLDTGTNASLISQTTRSKLNLQRHEETLLKGIVSSSSSAPSSLICLDTLRVGGSSYTNTPMRLSTMTGSGMVADPQFAGLLGSDFLQQFIVTLDLAHARIALRPDPSFRAKPYRFNTIGIQFRSDEAGSIRIVSVWTPSPAAEIGLKVGDKIEAIDGKSTFDESLDAVTTQLHGTPGRRLVLLVRSQDGQRMVDVTIRDLLHQRGPLIDSH